MKRIKIAAKMMTCFYLLCCCEGCGVIPKKLGTFPEEQVLLMDGRGKLLRPVGNMGKDTYSSLRAMDSEIEEKDKEKYMANAAHSIADQLINGKDVVIYLHGGMNMQAETMERSYDLLNLSKTKNACDGDIPYFVFVNWQSSLSSSYRDRIFAIREGKDYRAIDGNYSLKEAWNDLAGVFFYFPSDLLSGIGRSPVTLERQFDTFFSGSSFYKKLHGSTKYSNTVISEIDKDIDGIQNVRDFGRTIPSTLVAPFRIITTPIADSFGTHAWDIMQRRTSILFSKEVQKKHVSDDEEQEVGPLRIFGKELRKALSSVDSHKGKLTIIGHSMGTILAADFLRFFPDIHFDRVIFMASACSVRDLGDKIIPYLAKNKETEFYNLMLHPQAETRETNLFGIAPVGSLLVWIDQWFEKPDTVLDRTAGRYDNIGLNGYYLLHSMEKFHSVKNRVHFKVFPYRKWNKKQDVPMSHGSFDDFCFWQEEFWKNNPEESKKPKGYTRWKKDNILF